MEMAPGGNCPQRPRYHCPGSASEALLAGRGGITPSPYSDGLEFPCRPFYFRVPIPWVPGQVALVRQMPFPSAGYPTLDRKSVVEGRGWSVRLDLGGPRILKNKI